MTPDELLAKARRALASAGNIIEDARRFLEAIEAGIVAMGGSGS